MNNELFTKRALSELDAAAAWVAAENPTAAEELLMAAISASRLLAKRPSLGRQRHALLPAKYRFWPLRGFPYLLVYNAEATPIIVVRVVHMSRDLPAELSDLAE